MKRNALSIGLLALVLAVLIGTAKPAQAASHEHTDIARVSQHDELIAARFEHAEPARLKRQSTPSGPTYVFRCPVCRKTFRSKTMDPHLNPHKGTNGLPCPGAYGVYEGTKF